MRFKAFSLLIFGALLIAGCLTLDFAIPGGSPRGLSAGDLNGDGKMDVVVGHRPAPDGTGALRGASVLLTEREGLFRHRLVPLLNVFPNKTLLVDLNHDGKLDLAASYREDGGTGGVRVLLGQGNGEFTPLGELQDAASPVGLAYGDFDRDGHPDLVVSNAEPPSAPLQVHRGRGDGTFLPPQKEFSVKPTSEIAVGNLTGQEKPDVVLGSSEGTVQVLLGDGRGGLLAPLRQEVGKGSVSVALADMDKNDGLEIVAASKESRTVTVLSLAHFVVRPETIRSYPVDCSPSDVAAGDLDGDGEINVVVVDSETSSLHVLKGKGKLARQTGAALLEAGKTTGVGRRPTEVILADIDGSGRLRVITANEADSSITVFYPGPTL